ncbi:hypothetical protein [Mesorhizobium captivum]|uniref:hypothetical protein n=1 Tax=Mesorhizobium captivum TaxID=3072319 RepID=UPI002A24246C|nr:hypothetical protein [Mesorhizobium sp. VK23E]MDX8513549.1 hypothetical protein [Mesorhizobium sp. VK23E]
MMTLLQAAAAVTLWESGRFDTLQIAEALGGACRSLSLPIYRAWKPLSAACSMPCASASMEPISTWFGR